ncbi:MULTISPECIES: heme-binding protein [unclassified Ruegeria]|uniref:GlcG/HbpS family heme-binding protein n=1 Tax=unclassified Ruegeria TaxID=2625375 RepID=UPI001488E090|nr:MULTISPECIES: heme-binding protein [unclassified Ruegeria]
MDALTVETLKLSHFAVMKMLGAAIARAEEIGQPQCIIVVDASGETLGEIRMTDAKYLSRLSARAKARTAASIGSPSDVIPEAVRPHIAAATQGAVTGLGGGLPIRVGGVLVGGIGVGSGSPDQDIDVARAALRAVGADI